MWAYTEMVYGLFIFILIFMKFILDCCFVRPVGVLPDTLLAKQNALTHLYLHCMFTCLPPDV
jgi:hypothetical protein